MLAYIDGKTAFRASCVRFMASYWVATTARMQILAEVSEVTLTISIRKATARGEFQTRCLIQFTQ